MKLTMSKTAKTNNLTRSTQKHANDLVLPDNSDLNRAKKPRPPNPRDSVQRDIGNVTVLIKALFYFQFKASNHM